MKKIRKLTAVLSAIAIAMVMAFASAPESSVQAKGETWTSPGDGWSYLQGTDIKVKAEGEVLTIKGTGALPDYDYWTLYQRPWAKTTCSYLMIDDTITYIGSYEFYGMSNIKYISMGSATFINDSTAFERIANTPIFRIYGSSVTTKEFGNVSITSLESIERMAQSNWNGASYILDNASFAKKFQQSTNPTITNVFNAGDTNAPWNEIADNGNGGVSTTICKIASTGVSSLYGVSAQQKFPGNACYEAYGAFIGGYKLAATFNITLSYAGETVTKTNTPMSYTLTIPSEYRGAGSTFKLLAIGQGTVYTYDDTDTAYDTITFTTDMPTTSYALIYK